MATGDYYYYVLNPDNTATQVWNTWTTGTSTNAIDVSTYDGTWRAWQPAGTSTQYTIKASTTANNVWYQWVDWQEQGTAATYPPINVGVYQAPVQTKAEIRAAARAMAQRAKEALRLQKKAERENKLRQQKMLQAERRATRLLLALLNRQQKKEYRELKQITINHPGTEIPQYILKNTLSGNILEHDKAGKPIVRHCVHVGYGIPLPDNLATQVLYLKTKPEELLKVANHTRLQ